MDEFRTNRRILFLGSIAHTRVDRDDPRSMSELITPSGDQEVFKFSEADLVIFCDYDAADFRLLKNSNFPLSKRILVRVEPKPVLPQNYNNEFLASFNYIFDIGRPQSEFTSNFPWPQKWRILNTSHIRDEKIAIVAGNKISLISGELYSLRREIARSIENIDLFGTQWNISYYRKVRILLSEIRKLIRAKEEISYSSTKYWFRKPDNWKGELRDKHQELSKYRYSVVIENSMEFLTEKLFDALFAGCIPIYVGPKVTYFGIPEDLLIQASPSFESINAAICSAKEIDYIEWSKKVEFWLLRKNTIENWEMDHVYRRISKAIQDLE
jgi:hypothetical protein